RAGRATGSRLRPVPAAGVGQASPAAVPRPAAPQRDELGTPAARRPADRRADQGPGRRRPLGGAGQPDPADRRPAPAAAAGTLKNLWGRVYPGHGRRPPARRAPRRDSVGRHEAGPTGSRPLRLLDNFRTPPMMRATPIRQEKPTWPENPNGPTRPSPSSPSPCSAVARNSRKRARAATAAKPPSATGRLPSFWPPEIFQP